jgi:hypothetical protein
MAFSREISCAQQTEGVREWRFVDEGMANGSWHGWGQPATQCCKRPWKSLHSEIHSRTSAGTIDVSRITMRGPHLLERLAFLGVGRGDVEDLDSDILHAAAHALEDAPEAACACMPAHVVCKMH